MTTRTHVADVESQEEVQPAPLLRVFKMTYTDGEERLVSANAYDASSGNLIFIDIVIDGDKQRLFYRRTIAKGQWREVEEVTGTTQSEHVN